MVRIISHEAGSNLHYTGVDQGVLYPKVGPGVPWIGLLSVREKETSPDIKIIYMDGEKVQTEIKAGIFEASLSAYSYPLEFQEYEGISEDRWSGQPKKRFNLSYRTLIKSDILDGYQIHLVFNAEASITSRRHDSQTTNIETSIFEWDLATTPVSITDASPGSHLIIDSTKVYPAALVAIEEILYGTDTSTSRFPTMTEVLELFESFAIFKVTDQGNGIATVSGPDSVVYSTGPDSAIFSWPSVVQLDSETYRLTSL